MNKKPGRPVGSVSNTHVKIEDLLKHFQITDCIPVSTVFLKKYNLIGQKVNYTITKQPSAQIKEIDFNEMPE